MQNGFDPRAAAEHVSVPATELAPKPQTLDFAEAASLPLAGLTALQALRDDGDVQPGHHVVIRGASGGVGTLAVQIARALGAHVTGICSAKNRPLVEGLGADAVRAYDEGDPLGGLASVDVFFDVFGDLGFPRARRVLAPEGVYVCTLPRFQTARDVALALFSRQSARLVVVRSNRADLEVLARWVDDGRLRPVIDSTFPLEDIGAAHRRLETRRCRGKVVIDVASAHSGGGTGS
jgi:NADPH:quinone reductase-like Zn-dependent oxidoreductase